jgi:hypothetical protein
MARVSDHLIPLPIVRAAGPLGLVPLAGRLLRRGYEPRRLLAWLLKAQDVQPFNPAGWLLTVKRAGGSPNDTYMSQAKTQLEARAAQVARLEGAPVGFAATLPAADVAPRKNLNAARNKALNALEGKK